MVSCLLFILTNECTDATHMSQILASRAVPLLECDAPITAVPAEDRDVIFLGIAPSTHIHELAIGRDGDLAGGPRVALGLIGTRVNTSRQSRYGFTDDTEITIAVAHSESSERRVEFRGEVGIDSVALLLAVEAA